ncbi:unnamed protein product, partial [Cupriavidus sp. TA19]
AKFAIVGRSSRSDADIDYTYGIVPPGRGIVVYTSNCGNISAGVGPFAIDVGLVPARGPITEVRIFNTNTSKMLIAHVPVSGQRARVQGNFAIPGVPGTGAEIFMDYRATTGAKTGRVLPTGNTVDRIALEDGREIAVTLGDVANPCMFVRAQDLGRRGTELPNEINADESLLAMLRELRGKAAQQLGLCAHWRDAEAASPALPLAVMVAPSAEYIDAQGRAVDADQLDLQARLIFYNKCHESMAGTGSMCTAAMSRIVGTLVHEAAYRGDPGGEHSAATWANDTLRIGHPLGVMKVVVRGRHNAGNGPDRLGYERLGFSRTARRLMQGIAFVPRPALDI